MRVTGLAILLAVVIATFAGPVRAADNTPDTAVFTGAAAPAAGELGLARLKAKAATPGGVRVFVKLGVALENEDRISAAAADQQARTLADAQSGLVARALGGGAARHRVRTFRYIPYVAATVRADEFDRLLTDGGVQWIGEVGVRRPVAASQSWGVEKIEAPAVWKKGFKGKGVTIAVLDTGMQAKHPMIAGNVVEEMCFSTTDTSLNYKSFCAGGKEKVIGKGAAKYCSLTYGDLCAHGTHVTGIAGGKAWSGLTGVAPDTKLILGQVFSEYVGEDDPGPVAPDDDVVAALEQVYSLRKKYTIAAVNLSLGGGKYTGACDADSATYVAIFKLLREAKIAPIVGSANDYAYGSIGKPACVTGAIAVGATTESDKLADFSNHSQLVKMLAPGMDIPSAAPVGKKLKMSGTSQATPHVTGAFAILRNAAPSATVAQIERALECSGEPVSAANIEKTRIDVSEALDVLLAGAGKPKVFDFKSKGDDKAWKPVKGDSWKMAGGAYAPVFPTTPGYVVSTAFTPNCFADFDLKLDLKGMESSRAVYVYVKSQVDDTGKIISGYALYFVSWKYETGWRTLHAFARFDQYGPLGGPGRAEYPYSDCGLPASGPVTSIEVKVRGTQFTVIENGETVTKFNDPTYVTGSIGLGVESPYSGANAIELDKVTITSRDKSFGKKKDEAPIPADAPAFVRSLKGIEAPQC